MKGDSDASEIVRWGWARAPDGSGAIIPCFERASGKRYYQGMGEMPASEKMHSLMSEVVSDKDKRVKSKIASRPVSRRPRGRSSSKLYVNEVTHAAATHERDEEE